MHKLFYFNLILLSLVNLFANDIAINQSNEQDQIVLSDSIKQLDKTDFLETINGSTQPLIVEIFADWCQPCVQMAPIYKEVSRQMHDRCIFTKADFMQLKDETFFKEFNVQAIPTILVFNNKELIGKIVGLMDANNFKRRIDELLNPVDFESLTEAQLMEKLCTILQQADIDGLKKVIATKKINLNSPIVNQGVFSGQYPLALAYNYSSLLGDLGMMVINVLLEAGASPDIEVAFPGMTEKRTLCQLICNTIDQMEKMLENSKKAVDLIKRYSKS